MFVCQMAAMELYVIRHAIAEDAAPDQDDATRKLTPAGEKKLKAEVKGLRELGWVFDRVLTSPWVRARRTAELLAPVSEHALRARRRCSRCLRRASCSR